MVVFPHCKINLGLQVLRKRPDGYHDLSTCFYPVPWTDVLEILESDKTSFASSGLAIPGDPASNLCLKAYQLVKEHFNLPPVQIHLHKILPTGAGLGGGSADGTFTIRLLNEKFSLGMTSVVVEQMASRLGSDCAFFARDNARLGSGRGEVLGETNVTLAGKYIALVKPDVHVSTAEAYAGVLPQVPEKSLAEILSVDPRQWKNILVNDFETSIFKAHRIIQTVKEKLYAQGAFYASMSGSGAAVFGLFDHEPNLASSFPSMLYWEGKLN